MDELGGKILHTACQLISLPSVTPADHGCQDLLAARLADQGFSVTKLPYGDVSNFWATRGSGSPMVVFAGHTDVVPPGPVQDWQTDPFTPVLREGILYGRGSADMKGSLAAMLLASERFVRAQPGHTGTLAYLITSDEEGPALDGTRRVVEWLADAGIRPEYCIVGEPSSSMQVGDVIRIGRRGSLNGSLLVRGVQGHVAYPDQADNPIHKALPALLALTRQTWDEGNRAFPPTSLQISNIHAGTGAGNVIPGELRVDFNVRYSTEQTSDGLQARIREILNAHGLDFELAWQVSGEPFLTATDTLVGAVSHAVRSVQGFEPQPSTAGGTSDGRFIARLGTEIVEIGPVNASIHASNEHVSVADLTRLSDIYLGILRRLLANAHG